MAEAWARYLKKDLLDAYSAGVEARDVDPLAVRVMKEVGIDMSNQRSKHVETLLGTEFDYVITLCDHAQETCPFFPANTRLLHRGFEDPPKLAVSANNEQEALEHYRRVRDEIRDFVAGMPENLK
jgi:arsenate reductase